MKPIIFVYTESYYDAKRLFDSLYRPGIDKESLCTEKLWEDGECLEIKRDTEIWQIFKIASPTGAESEMENADSD